MSGKSSIVPLLLVLRTALVLLACGFATSCQEETPAAPDPAAILQAIPAADPAQYARIQDMKNWRNPYLIIKTDGVALFEAADNAEVTVKPEDLLSTLARLPASNWPYGRVVAATENATRRSEQDGVAIRRNKGIVGGILQGAHIVVRWVPGS